ncbi:MAG: molybdopterin-dependent oxidoreductase [SAR324 cluster bacterium]|nr:molybdopterin-dependent oxidoreductase [SAR324 cluster bacterium]
MPTPASLAEMPMTATHWGSYRCEVEGGILRRLHPFEKDPNPSQMGPAMVAALEAPARIRRPAIRRGWLEHGPQSGGTEGRGAEPFVEVPWDEALDLVAQELQRVKQAHGNEAIFAGSYGWASAGRFHHAQGHLRRFLNGFGGFVRSVNAYSHAAADVILPRVIDTLQRFRDQHTTWPVIAENAELLVAFGGLPLKNAQVNSGGVGAHTTQRWMHRLAERNVRVVNLSPLRDDVIPEVATEWLPLVPNTDTAVMLALAHTLVTEGLHDQDFLARCTVGFERFTPYLLGETDGQPKDAEWASRLSEIPSARIWELARQMARSRTVVSVNWSVQRGDHGEQPYWMAVVLAALLGQIGLPGGGLGVGLSAIHGVGNPNPLVRWTSLPQGANPVETFIPVARISDMLLHPGEAYDYDGQRRNYPDARIVYWAGGNPFHHHQDLNRLLQAWQMPETVIVHETAWNTLARQADIVLPVTVALERNDFAGNSRDGFGVAMRQVSQPVGEARNDFDIFCELAERLGFRESFAEGRDELEWVRHLYESTRERQLPESPELPDFDTFWEQGVVELPGSEVQRVQFQAFRENPEENPLVTPSGKIEIFSETIDAFGYADCPGHPVWQEPAEWLGGSGAGKHPLHLISNQPQTRLHSQLDHGSVSRESKVQGREPLRMHPDDAAARDLREGDVVRVFNDRGACLAGVLFSDEVRSGVVQLATGAWYDPLEPGVIGTLDRHGNPNMLTLDKGTSRLAQAPSAHSALVEVEKYREPLPPIMVFDPPTFAQRPNP